MKTKNKMIAKLFFCLIMTTVFMLVCACSRGGEGDVHDIGLQNTSEPSGSYIPQQPIVTENQDAIIVKLDDDYTMPPNSTEVIDMGDGEVAITWPAEWSSFFNITPEPGETETPEPTETAEAPTTAPAETNDPVIGSTATPEGPTPEPTIDDGDDGDWFGDDF